MRAMLRSSSWLNEMLFLRTAGTSRIGMATIPKEMEPVQIGRAMASEYLCSMGHSRWDVWPFRNSSARCPTIANKISTNSGSLSVPRGDLGAVRNAELRQDVLDVVLG